ncbi:site-specific DNA-methyltransferase [Rhizobium rhododendri]|uniref:site-specific DNA-methyltransferase (adenine-specific) n=1 Tax=Rhizobium rhododendri TaxID=2506430 RepID=A0ABY8IKX1_9HYPH|nr:site-specific DNA-methyltransferase [Rhizobium rhododendri]WFS23921.1 site-specific DNA-methyltransferase [Rhizobium rhododendri]
MSIPVSSKKSILDGIDSYTPAELKRLVVDLLVRPKVGLYWERDAVQRDRSLNDANVFLERDEDLSLGVGQQANLIIEGENFDALRVLRHTHKGKIRLIFIDPPYNTYKRDFVYNDRYLNKDDTFKQSTWLDFLFRRLKLAADLLSDDGAVFVCINDQRRAQLELLMDEVFPDMRVGSFVWKSRKSTNSEGDHSFSVDHEHVLVYARENFVFDGVVKKNADYKFTDPDGRSWASAPLNVSVRWDDKRAGNAYYPVENPLTGIWYPCNPDSVWRFASRLRLKEGQRLKSDPMEDKIAAGLVHFPSGSRVQTWDTMEDLLDAMDRGDVPESNGAPLLRRGLPDLDFWVGRKVGWGRPRLKRYLDKQEKDLQPVSSWVRSASQKEKKDDEDSISLEASYSNEGTSLLKEVFGRKVETTPKPLSLIRNILKTVSRDDDIVLDFFAGSGTTAHAVMALNDEDDGNRSYILVAATEETSTEIGKNNCRDICARRVRAVSEGWGKRAGLGGEFAYARTRTINTADLPFDLSEEHVWNTLTLLHGGVLEPMPKSDMKRVPAADDAAVYLCTFNDDASVEELYRAIRPHSIVYTDRPGIARQALAKLNVDIRDVYEAVLTATIRIEDE